MSPEGKALLDISQEQLDREFDEAARRYLNMSGDEFADLVARGGPLPKHPMTGHLLLMLGAGPREELVAG